MGFSYSLEKLINVDELIIISILYSFVDNIS